MFASARFHHKERKKAKTCIFIRTPYTLSICVSITSVDIDLSSALDMQSADLQQFMKYKLFINSIMEIRHLRQL